MTKTYIGDGIYADVENGELVLTTENGVETTNRIVLGDSECQSLVRFLGLFGITADKFA
jgi:hypothetical protein